MPGILKVIVHQGSPSTESSRPVIVPAKSVATDGAVWTVELLESPDGVEGLAAGDTIQCLKRSALRYPILVSTQYLSERRHAYFTPCEECGFPEGFDPPTVLAAVAFPGRSVTTATFAAGCPVCGGEQLVRLLPASPTTPRDASLEKIAGVVRDVVARTFDLSVDAVDVDRPIASLVDRTTDDLDALEIAFALEAHFVVCLPDASVDAVLTDSVEQLAARLQTTLARHEEGALLDLDA